MSTSVEDPWSIEPELREMPPRRFQPSEFPDLNAPNVLKFGIIGGVLILVGIVLLILQVGGLIPGILCILAGAASLAFAPIQSSKVRARAERLVRDGRPMMANIVKTENLTGESTYGRSVTYIVTLPGGETVRREVNADERVLPKRIPSNVTALLDPNNLSDVELYCALPLRAVPRPEAVSLDVSTGAAEPLAAAQGAGTGTMGTVDMADPDKPGEQTQTQTQQKSPSGYQGLPWE